MVTRRDGGAAGGARGASRPRGRDGVSAGAVATAMGAALAAAVGAVGAGARPAAAQSTPVGVGMASGAVHPSSRIGSGSAVGWGPTIQIPVGSWTQLETSVLVFPRTTTEQGDLRGYRATLPSATFRLTFVDGRTQVQGLVGGGALMTRLDASGANPRESRVVPLLGLGLGVRARLVEWLGIELTGRDWMGYLRENEFGATPGKRGLGHTAEFRLGLTAMLGRRGVTAKSVKDLPLAFSEGFRPIEATAVRTDPTRTDGGRTHVHTEDGQEVALAVVPADRLDGAAAPGSAATLLVASGPVTRFEERLLGDVYFTADEAQVTPQYRLVLENVARMLREAPTALLELRGYTDPRGTVQENGSLAERRATAVKELLVRLYGIDGLRISTTAMGVDFTSPSMLEARRVELRMRRPRVGDAGRAAGTPGEGCGSGGRTCVGRWEGRAGAGQSTESLARGGERPR